MVQQSCQEEITSSEIPAEDGNKPKGAKFSVKNFKANQESPNLQKKQMTLKSVPISRLFTVTSSVVITMYPESQLYVPKEETFPIPIKYLDITRSTHTDLNVM